MFLHVLYLTCNNFQADPRSTLEEALDERADPECSAEEESQKLLPEVDGPNVRQADYHARHEVKTRLGLLTYGIIDSKNRNCQRGQRRL